MKTILASTLTLLIFASTTVKAEVITCSPAEVKLAAKALGQVSPKNSALALKDDLSEIVNTKVENSARLTLSDVSADRATLKKAHCLKAYLLKKMPDLVERTVNTKQYVDIQSKAKRAALNIKNRIEAHPQEALKQRANLLYSNADTIAFVLVQGQMDKIILNHMVDNIFDFLTND